jgi:hypothetical protein
LFSIFKKVFDQRPFHFRLLYKNLVLANDQLENYITGQWITGDEMDNNFFNAVTGDPIATASTKGLDFKAMADYARSVGNRLCGR